MKRKDSPIIITLHGGPGTPIPFSVGCRGLIISPDYKMKDFKAIMVNGYMKNTSLWKEIVGLNLSE